MPTSCSPRSRHKIHYKKRVEIVVFTPSFIFDLASANWSCYHLFFWWLAFWRSVSKGQYLCNSKIFSCYFLPLMNTFCSLVINHTHSMSLILQEIYIYYIIDLQRRSLRNLKRLSVAILLHHVNSRIKFP